MDFSGFADWLGGVINSVLSFILAVLPDSPIKILEFSPIADILPYINYFIPIDFMLDVLAAWGTAILIYYGISILMRWVKAIQ